MEILDISEVFCYDWLLLIMFSVACTAFFAISLICVVTCFTMAIFRMIIMTRVCRGGVMFELLSFWASCIKCVSAMSHSRSGILLVCTAFLPSLVLSCLLFLVKFTDFLCHGYFLDVSAGVLWLCDHDCL